MKQYEDITGSIGELFPSRETPKVTMYSYSRPAYIFWQGFYSGLRDRGMTHESALKEMQSKGVRWMLDGNDSIEKLGRKEAKKYSIYHSDHPEKQNIKGSTA